MKFSATYCCVREKLFLKCYGIFAVYSAQRCNTFFEVNLKQASCIKTVSNAETVWTESCNLYSVMVSAQFPSCLRMSMAQTKAGAHFALKLLLNPLKPRQLRWLALFVMMPVAALGAVVLTVPNVKEVVSAGPIQHGHADISCSGCHKESPGTIRQQAQANVRYVLGLRQGPVDFGYAAVTSGVCLDCHERPNERHPIYRFNEPRFVEALASVQANSCLGCHTEHTEERAFVEPTFCVACHEDLTLKSDPIDVPHATLIADDRWETCLGCHDFHGNHAVRPQLVLDEAYDVEGIASYLADGPSPYGEGKIYEARKK